MKEQDIIRAAFERHLAIAAMARESLTAPIAKAATMLIDCLKSGGKILICGNGGSAADAQHFAAELTGRYLRERRGLPAVALTTDSSALTAIGNDFGFDRIFSRQIEALCSSDDLVLLISTSGNSRNLLAAAEAARLKLAPSVALLGRDGGSLAPLVDCAVIVPSDDTQRIQEVHALVLHLWCEWLEPSFS